MKELTDLQELQGILAKEMGVLIYFYNDDCPPCISLRPKVEVLMQESFPKMAVAWVNSKTSPEIPAAFQVFANPTLLVFFEGKEFRRFSKYVSVSELEQAIERYYGMAF